MAIDWTKYQPKELSDELERSLTHEIADGFLRHGEGLPYHQKKVALGEDWRVLNDLINKQFFIRNIADRLYPGFAALYFTPELRTRCEAVVESLLKALRFLYERKTPPHGRYDLAQLSEAIKNAHLGDAATGVVRQGTVFLLDFADRFGLTNFNWGSDGLLESFYLSSDEILDFESLSQAWDQVWNRRYPAQHPAPESPPQQSRQAARLIPRARVEDFAFVADERLRQIVCRDHGELKAARDANALKSRIVLAGGLIEAVLLDALLQHKDNACASIHAPKDGKKVKPLEEWDLSHLIKVAVELRLVSEDAQRHSDLTRTYRNLVHPGLELRSGQTVRHEVANIAEQVLEMVISDIRNATREDRDH